MSATDHIIEAIKALDKEESERHKQAILELSKTRCMLFRNILWKDEKNNRPKNAQKEISRK